MDICKVPIDEKLFYTFIKREKARETIYFTIRVRNLTLRLDND